jgi:hypothetical protein
MMNCVEDHIAQLNKHSFLTMSENQVSIRNRFTLYLILFLLGISYLKMFVGI